MSRVCIYLHLVCQIILFVFYAIRIIIIFFLIINNWLQLFDDLADNVIQRSVRVHALHGVGVRVKMRHLYLHL